jgi:6-pyruvoyltetrahydropterin/6-carboxytetrahydropterin synthase
MFEIEKIFTFEAGHTLPHHDGKCAHRHGHSYILKVAVRRDDLTVTGPQQGMVIDFQCIKSEVQPMLDTYFDHQWLNDTLHVESPTAEVIAKWIYTYLDSKIEGLYRVTIFETATSSASYSLRE